MRLLHTLVCAAAISYISAPSASGQSALHPEIGTTPPSELKAFEILSLSNREKQAWMAGAVAAMAQAASEHDVNEARCITDWYFRGGDGAEFLEAAFEQYRNAYATSVLAASIRQICRN